MFRPMTAAAFALAASAAAAQPVKQGPPHTDFEPAFPQQTRAPAADSGVDLAVEKIAGPLVHPWGVAVLPGGGYLVTERPGRLRYVAPDGTISDPIAGVPEVFAQNQGGLLDVTLSPEFAQDRTVYLTYSKPMGQGLSATAAARGRLSEDRTRLEDVHDIFVQEPPSPTPAHYGSRIVIDGDIAWITTGEHFTKDQRVYAQDLDKTYGKVIRVRTDGSVPQDNPFVGKRDAIGSIWSFGHRNIQAAAIRPSTGELWIVEHGPQGGDELNRPEAGRNYGWPVVSYGENYDGTPVGSGESAHAPRGFVEPRYYWDPVIAPSGATFYTGDLFPWQGDLLIGSLTPGALVRLEMEGDTVVGEERLLTDRGRIRDVVEDRDGALLVVTDEDRGELLRLTPK